MFVVSRFLPAVLSTAIIMGAGLREAAAAAQHQAVHTPTSTRTSMIEGVALNAVTGMPVKKARVMLRYAIAGYELRYSTDTDASGRFMVTNIKPGSYWLSLQKKGFLEQQADANPKGPAARFLNLSTGQRVRDILLRAIPCSVITGSVLTENGDPITGAEVQAMRWSQDRRGAPMRVTVTRTNDLGEYRLYGLTPGIYYVSARYDAAEESSGGIERIDSLSEESYVRTFYPNTDDPAVATPIAVGAGMEVSGIDLNVVKDRGKPIISVTLAVRTEDERGTGQELGSDPEPLQPIAAKDRQPAIIEGTVVNRVTGAPIRGVNLILRGTAVDLDAPYVVRTDAHGHFRMNKVEPGQYRLWAADKGLPEQEYSAEGRDAAGNVLTVMPGQHLQGILFRVTPPAVITGRVLDEDGEPILGADVQATRFSYRDGRRQVQIESLTVTNDLGEFRLHGLEPGRYYVSTSPELALERNTGDPPASKRNARTFYPHTLVISAATPISVAPGEEVGGIEISSIPARGVKIAGQVLVPTTTSISGEVVVTLVSRDSSGLAFSGDTTGADSQGRFVLQGVLPGSYFLWVNWFHRHEQYSAGQMIEVANSDIHDLRLAVSKAVNVVGTLRIEGTHEQSTVNLHIALESESGVASSFGTGVKRDGSFVITSVPPLKYNLSVLGMSDGLYIKSLDVSGEILPDLTLDIGRVGGGPITVVLSSLGRTIHGRVVDENQLPARVARVILVPDESSHQHIQLYKTATANSNGQFTLFGVSPGKYTLFASRDIESDAYLNPDFLQKVEEFGQEITVSESSSGELSNKETVVKLMPSIDENIR